MVKSVEPVLEQLLGGKTNFKWATEADDRQWMPWRTDTFHKEKDILYVMYCI